MHSPSDDEGSTYARVPSAFDIHWNCASSPTDSTPSSSGSPSGVKDYSDTLSHARSISFAEIFEIQVRHLPVFAHELSTLHKSLRMAAGCERVRDIVQREGVNVSVVVLQTWTSAREWKTAMRSAPYLRFLEVTRGFWACDRQVVHHTTIASISAVEDDDTIGWQAELAKMDTLWTENFMGPTVTNNSEISLDMLLR